MIYQILTCILFLFSTATHGSLLSSRKELFGLVLYSCNFENDTCQMSVESSPSGFTWLRLAGSTPSETTGPDFDHTTLTAKGYYMYTEATGYEPQEVTRLRLPSLPGNQSLGGPVCLTFWYHLYGQHIGTLNVTQNDDVLFSISFNQSYEWFQQNVTVRVPSAGPIAFVGVRGGRDIGQPYGDVAIDDVIIYAEPCEYDTTTESITTTATTPTTTPITTTTSPVTTTEMRTSTNSTTLQPSSLTSETVAATVVLFTTQQHNATTQGALRVKELNMTSSQPVVTTNVSTGVSNYSTEQLNVTSVNVLTTRTSTDSASESRLNDSSTLDTNVTTSTQSSAFSTDVNASTQVSGANNTMKNNDSVSRPPSPAAVEMTTLQTTTSANETNSTTDYSVNANYTTNSNSSLATNTSEWQATAAMELGPSSQESSSTRIWNLSEQNLILILAFLSAFILILILVVCVLACCLCVTRRRYNVALAENHSSTTLDNNSDQGRPGRKDYSDYS